MAVPPAGPGSPDPADDVEPALGPARAHFLAGRYAEALAAVEALHANRPDDLALQARAALLGAMVGWNAKQPAVGVRWAEAALDASGRLRQPHSNRKPGP